MRGTVVSAGELNFRAAESLYGDDSVAFEPETVALPVQLPEDPGEICQLSASRRTALTCGIENDSWYKKPSQS